MLLLWAWLSRTPGRELGLARLLLQISGAAERRRYA
jgi:hypothetical protein